MQNKFHDDRISAVLKVKSVQAPCLYKDSMHGIATTSIQGRLRRCSYVKESHSLSHFIDCSPREKCPRDVLRVLIHITLTRSPERSVTGF
ncbi:Dehydrogenase orsE [Fusarium oxysporum f. sp. albedinis]|nr:Dehydrogenase orsE [Fusarium oxysporum f. sp. albedinis]